MIKFSGVFSYLVNKFSMKYLLIRRGKELVSSCSNDLKGDQTKPDQTKPNNVRRIYEFALLSKITLSLHILIDLSAITLIIIALDSFGSSLDISQTKIQLQYVWQCCKIFGIRFLQITI